MASDWGFNFRNGYACDSDSSDDDAAPKTETDLIRDFDLGSRDEGGVKYKPNPFSIAKINAAARGEPTAKQGGGKSGKAQGRGKSQAKKAGGGTIEHAFKTQAARPRNKAVKEPAAKQAPRSRPFQDPRIDRPTPPPPAQAPSPPIILATTNAATNPLATVHAAAFAPTTASTKETAASDAHIPTSLTASTDLAQEAPVLTPTSPQRQSAHIPTFRPRPRIPRLQYNVQSSPLRSQLPRSQAARHAPLSSPAQLRAYHTQCSTTSSTAAPRASSRPAVPQGSTTHSQPKRSSGMYAGDPHSRSSPAKLDFRRLQAQASRRQATPARSVHPTAFDDQPQILQMRPANKPSSPRPPSITTMRGYTPGRSSPSLKASSPSSSVSRKRPISHSARGPASRSPSRLPSAYATSFGDADEEWSTLSAPLRPGKRQKVNGVSLSAPFSISALWSKAGTGGGEAKARKGLAAKARTGTGITPRGGTRPPGDSRARDTVRKSGVSPGSSRRVITFLPPPLPSSVASKPVSRPSAPNAEERDDSDVLPSVNDADEPRFQFSVDDVGRLRSSSPLYARSSSPTLVGANPRTPVYKDAPYSAYDQYAPYDDGSVTMHDAIRPGYDDNFPLRADNALLYAGAGHPSDGATCYDDARPDAHTHYYGAQARGHDAHAHHYDDYDDADDSMLANIDLEGVQLRFPALKARLRSVRILFDPHLRISLSLLRVFVVFIVGSCRSIRCYMSCPCIPYHPPLTDCTQ
ncbi:hypothetical protein K525DRAFT_260403 [Schizophyllum commune Loenen D]|nr:hypothetical protein K525DRAFT_260403 [Schizophyllum commune Loenen D]